MNHSILTRAPAEAWVSDEIGDRCRFPGSQLVFVFGPREVFDSESISELNEVFPEALIVSSSTSGDILDATVSDGKLIATAVRFERTRVASCLVKVDGCEDSYRAGCEVAKELDGKGLCHVLIFSDGQMVNGAQLVRGLNEGLPDSVSISGGLAGDGTLFQKTLVGLNEVPTTGNIVGIGFYGENLLVGSGSGGGWQPFGPERIVTKSEGNVLFEIDGENALMIYKRYLGDQAAGLPASALKFPLSLKLDDVGGAVVRTILSIDEAQQSMTFAGEVPAGAKVRLMRGFLDDLIEGASDAANAAKVGEHIPDLTLCVSCVGRRIVFGQRVEEELESVQSVLGSSRMIGMYSYGEVGRKGSGAMSQLHNQSICITTFKELNLE